MKLYHKHGKLFNNSYELNNNDVYLCSRLDSLCNLADRGLGLEKFVVRRQAWLDVETKGKECVNIPFIFSGKLK